MGIHSVTGVVTKLLYESTARQVFNLKTTDSTMRVFFDDPILRVNKGEHVQLCGAVECHQQYGEQFNAKQLTYSPLSDDMLKDFLMQGSGIGKAIAEQVMAKFSDNLIEILETKNIEELQQVKYVTRALAIVLTNQWHEQQGKAHLLAFMDGMLKNTNAQDKKSIIMSAKRAFNFYGEETAQKLQDDPYRIWSFGTFKSAEIFARAIGVALNDDRRLICAVEESLYRKLRQGSTQVYPLDFQEELESIVGSALSIKAIIAANHIANTSQPRLVVKHHPQVNPQFQTPPSMTQESKNIYNQSYALPGIALMEEYVQEQLFFRIKQHVNDIDVSDNVISKYCLPEGHYLNHDQQCAVKTILTNSVTCISGGAGTGKTSILYAVNTLIKDAAKNALKKTDTTHTSNKYKKEKKHVLQVALAGKAAQRLIQQTSDDAMTIAALLKGIEKNDKFLDAFETPVLHIDEGSMVDLQTIYRVLKVFEGRPMRLVFIGDWAQLSPIGYGLVFHQLMKSDIVASVELKHNYRSKGGIIDVSEKIKKGMLFTNNDEVEIIEYDDESVIDIVREQYTKEVFNGAEVHAIAGLKRTVSECNIAIHKLLRKRDRPIPEAEHLRENDSVIYKKNNKYLKLVNGSTGRVLYPETNIDSDGKKIHGLVVDFLIEGQKFLKMSDVKDVSAGEYYLQHAYALTCHSAQGSEFDTAIIVVENIDFIERSWLYTALTRAKKRAILIVKRGELQKVLARGFSVEKINCGLDFNSRS